MAENDYTVYAWLKDDDGDISDLSNGGLGTVGHDKAEIRYNAGEVPIVHSLVATSVDAPSSPPSASELKVAVNQKVYIKWKVSDVEGLISKPISIYYTLDEINYYPVIENISNGQSNICTVDHGSSTLDDGSTGCYAWNFNQSVDSALKIRVKVTDTSGQSATMTSAPLNAGNIVILAGNTDIGIGGQARTAVFYPPYSSIKSVPIAQKFAIDKNGVFYFLDHYQGLLRADPATGILEILVKKSNSYGIENGAVEDAGLYNPFNIALDNQERVLIFDHNRIRRVNSNTRIIETIIGGNLGVDTSDEVSDPLTLKLYNGGVHVSHTQFKRPLYPLPNGDLLFFTREPWNYGYPTNTDDGYRIRHYHADTNSITSIIPTGTGTNSDETTNVSECTIRTTHIGYNKNYHPQNSPTLIESIWFDIDGSDGCNDSGYRISPSVFQSLGHEGGKSFEIPSNLTGYSASITGRDGNTYAIHRGNNSGWYFNKSTEEWEKILGGVTIPGSCADGINPTDNNCQLDLIDIFVSKEGRIYFYDGSRIRYIDDKNTADRADDTVETFYGQTLFFGDGGNPVNARFGEIKSFGYWYNNDGKLMIDILDNDSRRIREFELGGNISTIAGDGSFAYMGNSLDTDPLIIGLSVGTSNWYTRDGMIVDSDGDIYLADWAKRGIVQLKASDRAGGWNYPMHDGSGSKGVDWFDPADDSGWNRLASQIYLNYTPLSINGWDPIQRQLAAYTTTTDSNGLIKSAFVNITKDPAANPFKFSYFARGINGHAQGVNGTSASWCNDGSRPITGNSENGCATPSSNVYWGQKKFVFDKGTSADLIDNRWLVNVDGHNIYSFPTWYSEADQDNSYYRKYTYATIDEAYCDGADQPDQGQCQSAGGVWNIARDFGSFDVARTSEGTSLFTCERHCSGSACRSASLYKRTLLPASNESTGSLLWSKPEKLEHGLSDFHCHGQLFYNETRNSVIFSFVQNSYTSGIAEYVFPSLPQIASNSLTINSETSGNLSVTDPSLLINIQGSDLRNDITDICFKYNSNTPPSVDDDCWQSITNKGLSVNITNKSFDLGKVKMEYIVYAWLKDDNNEISSLLNDGEGEEGTDKFKVSYDPGPIPDIDSLVVTDSNDTSTPATWDNLKIETGESAYIKWKVSDDDLKSKPISLYYTIDGSSFIKLHDNTINNSINGSCSLETGKYTGCYVWPFQAMPSEGAQGFQIRLVVEDQRGQTAAIISNFLNVEQLRILAGNIDSGFDVSANNTSFENHYTWWRPGYPSGDHHRFVVTESGAIYFNDSRYGILTIQPSDGLLKVLIPKDPYIDHNGSEYSVGEIRNISESFIKSPYKINLDHQGNLIILDYDRIKRINLNANPITIETIIGGGATLDNVDNASDFKFRSPLPFKYYDWYTFQMSFLSLPNGDIIFGDGGYYWKKSFSQGFKIWWYHASDKSVSSIRPSGIGSYNNPNADVTTCKYSNTGFSYNLSDSSWKDIIFKLHGSGQCGNATNDNFRVNTETFESLGMSEAAAGMAQGHGTYANMITGMDGEIYLASPYYNHVYKFNSTNKSWNKIIGYGYGHTEDGAAANGSFSNVQGIFVTKSGKVYYLDRNMIRMIDKDGKIQTVYGRGGDDAGKHVSATRFLYNIDFSIWNNNGEKRITTYDIRRRKFLEFPYDGDLIRVAGNGKTSTQPYPYTDYAASENTIPTDHWSVLFPFIQDPSNGNIYWHRNQPVTMMLNRSSDRWETISGVGGGDTNSAGSLVRPIWYDAPEGTKASEMKIGYDYIPAFIGFDATNNQLLLWNQDYKNQGAGSAHNHSVLFTLDLDDDYSYSKLAGQGGDDQGDNYWCANGTVTEDCHLGTRWYAGPAQYDAYGERWIMPPANGSDYIFSLKRGGTKTTLYRTSWGIRSMAYRHDENHNLFYWCAANGYLFQTDLNVWYAANPNFSSNNSVDNWEAGRSQLLCNDSACGARFPDSDLLFSKNLNNPNAHFGSVGLRCSGGRMRYDSENNTLIFPFTKNGHSGIAEYKLAD